MTSTTQSPQLEPPRVVAITGASGYVGSRLIDELEHEEGLERILALDTNPLQEPAHRVISLRRDVTKPMGNVFYNFEVDTVVHLAFDMRTGYTPGEVEAVRRVNVGGLDTVLKSCKAAKVRHVVYLSSHTVYGAHSDNPRAITEDHPLRPLQGFQYGMDKHLCEELLTAFAAENKRFAVTILRSCVVIGPNANNYVVRAFFKPILVGVLGYNPHLQFIHESDLARVLALMVMEPRPGVYNVAVAGALRYTRVARLAGRKVLFLPAFVAYPLVELTWKLGFQRESPSIGLNFIRYPIVLSTEKLTRETGFTPQYSAEEALLSYVRAHS